MKLIYFLILFMVTISGEDLKIKNTIEKAQIYLKAIDTELDQLNLC